jgi:uncharacterized protein YabN with tetrapyrrole methylase and pyrophosphatase domain
MIDTNFNYLKRFFLPFQNKVGRWGERTFPESTLKSIQAHMEDEVKELKDAVGEWNDNMVMEELSDIVLLCIHAAYKMGKNLIYYTIKKFAICKLRKWGEPDSRGVRRHI